MRILSFVNIEYVHDRINYNVKIGEGLNIELIRQIVIFNTPHTLINYTVKIQKYS